MEETNQIIKELLNSLKENRKHGFQVQHDLLKESIKQTNLYAQILTQLSIQNEILREKKNLTVVENV